MKKVIAAAVMAMGMSAGLTAAADNVVTKVEGETPSVVLRGSEVIQLKSDFALITGDRIISAEGSSLTLSNGECERTFNGASAIVIDEDFCDAESGASFVAGGDPVLGLDGGPESLIAILATAAVIATVVVVAGDNDDDEDPTSP